MYTSTGVWPKRYCPRVWGEAPTKRGAHCVSGGRNLPHSELRGTGSARVACGGTAKVECAYRIAANVRQSNATPAYASVERWELCCASSVIAVEAAMRGVTV